MTQGPRAEPARWMAGAWCPAVAETDWIRDWSAICDPLGGEALPLVMKVYGWLSLATSETTRGLRNQPFDAVLLPGRDRENQEAPLRGGLAQDDHERVLQEVIWT